MWPSGRESFAGQTIWLIQVNLYQCQANLLISEEKSERMVKKIHLLWSKFLLALQREL